MKKLLLLCTGFALASGLSAQVYKDPKASIDDRVKDLLSRMDTLEKIGQMSQENLLGMQMKVINNNSVGSVLTGGGAYPNPNTSRGFGVWYDTAQSYAQKTRLQIPLIYGIDALHGNNNVKGAVIFPHNIGLGCTRNPELVKKAARVTAEEVAATGVNWTFAPCVAVPQDIRWGRTYEGYSENTQLVTELGAAAVVGYQGDTLSGKTSILATAKHFIADGGTDGGRNTQNATMDTATLKRIHLPPYIEAIKKGVGSVMISYSSWNGVKCHANKYLITDLLKGELGFKGFVISDWTAVDQIKSINADNPYKANLAVAINSGVDMVMVPQSTFYIDLLDLIRTNTVPMSRIDDAVSRIIRVKMEKGLFENPYGEKAVRDSLLKEVGSQSHRAVARECVRNSLVVLKNEDNTLPIKSTVKKIHVAGMSANDIGNQCGGWTIEWQGSSGKITTGTTILEAIKKAAPNAQVTFSENGSGAEGADIGIAVIGELPYSESSGDRSEINIEVNDFVAVRTMKNAGIPVVTVIFSGRPVITDRFYHWSDAVVAAWLPGTEGEGITDILFGAFQPTGMLSYSWPRTMSQIPIHFGDKNYDPLFPFGFGLQSLQNSAVGSAPVLQSAAVGDWADNVELAFNKTIKNSYSNNDFTVLSQTKERIPVISISQKEPSVLVLQLAKTLEVGNYTIAYSGTSVSAVDGGVLKPIEDSTIYMPHKYLSNNVIPAKVPYNSFFTSYPFNEYINAKPSRQGLLLKSNNKTYYHLQSSKEGLYCINVKASSLSGAQLKLELRPGIIDTLEIAKTDSLFNVTEYKSKPFTLKQGSCILEISSVSGDLALTSIIVAASTSSDAPIDNANTNSTDVNVYPNPGHDVVTVYSKAEITSITIIDFAGSVVFKKDNVKSSSEIIDIKDLNPGIYQVEVIDENDKIYQKKIVKI